MVRIVVINKRPRDSVNLNLVINKPGGWGTAEVTRLVAQGGLEAKTGISLGGQYFDDNAQLQGAQSVEKVNGRVADGKSVWTVSMPPASAALIKIPKL